MGPGQHPGRAHKAQNVAEPGLGHHDGEPHEHGIGEQANVKLVDTADISSSSACLTSTTVCASAMPSWSSTKRRTCSRTGWRSLMTLGELCRQPSQLTPGVWLPKWPRSTGQWRASRTSTTDDACRVAVAYTCIVGSRLERAPKWIPTCSHHVLYRRPHQDLERQLPLSMTSVVSENVARGDNGNQQGAALCGGCEGNAAVLTLWLGIDQGTFPDWGHSSDPLQPSAKSSHRPARSSSHPSTRSLKLESNYGALILASEAVRTPPLTERRTCLPLRDSAPPHPFVR